MNKLHIVKVCFKKGSEVMMLPGQRRSLCVLFAFVLFVFVVIAFFVIVCCLFVVVVDLNLEDHTTPLTYSTVWPRQSIPHTNTQTNRNLNKQSREQRRLALFFIFSKHELVFTEQSCGRYHAALHVRKTCAEL